MPSNHRYQNWAAACKSFLRSPIALQQEDYEELPCGDKAMPSIGDADHPIRLYFHIQRNSLSNLCRSPQNNGGIVGGVVHSPDVSEAASLPIVNCRRRALCRY
jgi:hypothetical protein